MKHTNLLFISLALGSMAISSCTESEPVSDNGQLAEEKAIRFAVNTEHTRAGDITTNNLTSFHVYAYTNVGTTPSLFMDNVEVSKTGTNTWTYSPVEYWPANETVDFYAYAPAGWIGKGTPFGPVAYDAYPGTQDIVYAVCPDMKGNVGMANAQVLLNFRHALSKVTVKMSSTNTDLQVKVSNVALANLMTKGNFNFPSESTAGSATEGSVGKWTDQNTPHAYLLHMSQDQNDLITLSTTATDMSATGMGLGGAKYMIPQTLSWRSNGAGNDNYITVMCSIYDAKTGAKLWPNDNTPSENIVEGSTFGDGLLKFPLSTSRFSAWEPGYHYVYNLVINSNDEMGAIEFGTPTVDTFVDVSTTYE